MRTGFMHIARAAVAVLAASVGVVVLPQPAAAVTLPPLKFAAVSLAPNLTYPQTLVSQKDGGVTVGDCGSGISNDGFQQYSTTGTLAQNAANTVSGRPISFCDKQATVGADGTVYTVAFNPSTNKEVLLAFQGGTQQWMYAPPCAVISAVELGTNGNIYMLASGSSACSGQRLLGIEPTLANGQTTPAVVMNTILYRNLPYRGGLSPYSGGVIVRYLDGVGFFTYTGTQQQEYTVPAGAYDGGPFATVNGWAMVPILDEAPRPFNCSNDTQAAEYVVAYSVSGVVWSNQLPDCTRVDALRPMPDGGVVALVKLRDNNLQTLTQHFVGIAPETGQTFRWTSDDLVPETGTVQSGFAFVTDLNGNLVLQRQVKRRDNSDGLDYGEVTIGVSSGYTGIGFGETKFAGDSSDGYGFMAQSGFGLVPSITNGRVYAALTECNGYSNCTNSTTKLYAASVPGMAMDYPRGAVLKYNEPWLDYVALGDSFSSGEGVEPYLSGTDIDTVNECHRSLVSYPMRLDTNSSLRLSLGALRACSGSTSTHALDGWPANDKNDNEGKQVDRLNNSSDVVTLTMGGNDVRFVDFVTACLYADCGDPTINNSFYDDVANSLAGSNPSLGDPNGSGLRGLYHTIATKAPNARVYVAGYPQLMPTTACAQTDQWMAAFNTIVTNAHNEGSNPGSWTGTLHGIGVVAGITPLQVENLRAIGAFEFNASEVAAARLLVTRLNNKIEDTIDELNDPDFVYVDPEASGSPFIGHELCTSSPYFIGLDAANKEHSYHPNSLGQDAYRKLFVSYM